MLPLCVSTLRQAYTVLGIYIAPLENGEGEGSRDLSICVPCPRGGDVICDYNNRHEGGSV
jgi:hypothetical protein